MIERLAAIALLTMVPGELNGQATCPMSADFSQPDRDGTRLIPVWRDPAAGALLFADSMNINTDGTRRSYSVDDFWGERIALNNLCNAMSDACAGLSSEQLRQRRLVTQLAKARGWPADLLGQSRLSPSIIPRVNGRPCPEVGGYLVSATALARKDVGDVCRLERYVDALKVNAIVLPKRVKKTVPTRFEQRGAAVGDLAVVLSGDGRLLEYAVVGDSGPADELGEISVALAQRLTGRGEPANYQEIRGRGPFKGRGWSVGKTYLLIFPGSRDRNQPYMTQERIDQEAGQKLKAWGGAERLRSCASNYGG